MKKLLLTSSGLSNTEISQEFLNLIRKPVKEITVLFVPTASRSENELFYVEKAKQQLLSLGILKENIINFSEDSPVYQEQNFDTIIVCGGNSFYLLSKLKETKYFDFFNKKVNDGVTYVGISAGSVIATQNISYINGLDLNDCELKDVKAFGWIDGLLVPHYNEDTEMKDYVESLRKERKQLYLLTNEQAIKIVGNKKIIVGKIDKIKC